MTGVLVFVLVAAAWLVLGHWLPTRIGARLAFWLSTLCVISWLLDAVADAMDHRWLPTLGDLAACACCLCGMWAWSDDLRRDRAEQAVAETNGGGS